MPAESQDTPVLDTIAAMTAVSVAECELAPNALMAVRLAALAAVDAGPASYLLNIGPAAEAGITIRGPPERPRGRGTDHWDGPGHVGRDQYRRGPRIGHRGDRGGIGVSLVSEGRGEFSLFARKADRSATSRRLRRAPGHSVSGAAVSGGRAKVVDYADEVKTTISTCWSRPRMATRSGRPPGYSASISG